MFGANGDLVEVQGSIHWTREGKPDRFARLVMHGEGESSANGVGENVGRNMHVNVSVRQQACFPEQFIRCQMGRNYGGNVLLNGSTEVVFGRGFGVRGQIRAFPFGGR